jgi:hypothetical protein
MYVIIVGKVSTIPQFHGERGAEHDFDFYIDCGTYFFQVGMKEKVAAVLFATSTQALIFCAFHDNCVGPDYKVIQNLRRDLLFFIDQEIL